jgi:hypothetical protein
MGYEDKNKNRSQRFFVKDGDDYVPRRPKPMPNPGATKMPRKRCECGGKLVPKGSIGIAGKISSRCNKCGKRKYTTKYRGVEGLEICY